MNEFDSKKCFSKILFGLLKNYWAGLASSHYNECRGVHSDLNWYILIQCLALSAKIEQKNITVKIYTWEISFVQITLLIISEAVKHVYYWVVLNGIWCLDRIKS